MQDMDGLTSGRDIGAEKRLNPLERKALARRKAQSVSADEIRSYCDQGFTLQQIADKTQLSPLAVARAIERIVRKGERCTTDHLIPAEIRTAIQEAFYALRTSSIKKVHHYLKASASEAQIRIVRGILQAENRDTH